MVGRKRMYSSRGREASAEHGRVESSRVVSSRVESSRGEASRAGSGRVELRRVESSRVKKDREAAGVAMATPRAKRRKEEEEREAARVKDRGRVGRTRRKNETDIESTGWAKRVGEKG